MFEEEVSFIHLEGDMMLTRDFPVELFSQGSLGICWTTLDFDCDMPGLISMKVRDVPWFLKNLTAQLHENPGVDDMQLLNKIRVSFPEKVSILPSILNGRAFNSGNVIRLETEITGIFDPAYYGQWFLGENGRNHWGIVKRKRELREFLDLSGYALIHENKSVFLEDKFGVRNVLYSLHVHSKERVFFAPGTNLVTIANRARRSGSVFSPMALAQAVIDLMIAVARRLKRFTSRKEPGPIPD